MRIRTGLLILLVALTGAFTALNWQVLMAPARFNLLLGSAEIPMGAALGAMMLALAVLFAGYLGLWQRRVINDYRRQAAELQAQRSLAEDAEASRFTALGALMREQLAALEQRLVLALQSLRDEMHATEGSISATLAEMDDRMRTQSDRSAPS